MLGDLNFFAKNSEFCCAVARVGKEIRCFHFLSRLRLTLEPPMWSSWPVAYCLILKPPFWIVFQGSEREVEVQTSALDLILQIFHIYCSQLPFRWNEQTSCKDCLPGFWLAQLQSLWIALRGEKLRLVVLPGFSLLCWATALRLPRFAQLWPAPSACFLVLASTNFQLSRPNHSRDKMLHLPTTFYNKHQTSRKKM